MATHPSSRKRPGATPARRSTHYVFGMGTGESPSILYVEDDHLLRESISEALEMEGFVVRGASSAEEALAALESRRYDILLTDYLLPRQNGDWLLRQAATSGFLEETSALVFTGEDAPPGVDGYPCLNKTIDLPVLLSALRGMLETKTAARTERPGSEDLVLVLYVVSGGPVSDTALARIRETLSNMEARSVELRVVNAQSREAESTRS
jgi:CheY-like chemotaxis protein